MNPDRQTLDELRIDRAAAPRGRPYGLLLVILLLVVAGSAGATWWFNRPRTAIVRTVTVQQPSSGEERTLLNASGYVTARREATVSSKVTGKVEEIYVEEGMRVEAGQTLARLDSSNVARSLELAQAQQESARATLIETEALLEQAEREFARITGLAEKRVASQSELDSARAEAKSLEARLERQKADVAVSEREVAIQQQLLDDMVIRAPFTGIVTSKTSQPGEMISPMSAGGSFTRTGICTIVDMDSLEIEVDVSESYINRVQPEQPVEAILDSYPDWRIPARVIAIIPTADRQKATVKVRVGFEQKDPRILPEMSVKVAFQKSEEATPTSLDPTIPQTAIRQREGGHVVWIVRDGRVERRAVTIGSTRGEQVAVSAGISGGERVVVDGPDELTDGDQVSEVE
ncbi:efflux transporter periplasmic adaptor subunit [Bacillus paralicheniformis]|uniref:Efflux RND transporter periplasmic adaptor subunit n=1 Tax=uncultured organism TaxID=155900 RepID=A0A6G7MAN1_9ZZZZ|nr:efflux transporter periplasmic adaptor subunit [Bacillus paralicheniformis]QIJ31401.1 efflux RND transporter periplasmic adaptor subunit [uncultured organism]